MNNNNNKKILPSLILICGLAASFNLVKQPAEPQSIYSPQDLALLKEAREREKKSPEVKTQVQSPEVKPQVQSPEVKPQVQTASSGSVTLAKVANSTCTQLVNSGEIPEEAFAECVVVVAEDMLNRL